MTTEIYSLKTITSLHVGSGGSNYGVIDNLVQRDPNTNLPIINASSLKGALREYFKQFKPEIVDHIFGKDISGSWKFLSACLLSRPLRSDKSPFFNACSINVLKDFVKKATSLNALEKVYLQDVFLTKNVQQKQPVVLNEGFKEAIIEEQNWRAKYDGGFCEKLPPELKALIGDNIVFINDTDFENLDLPVVARNHLESGESKNLWYEEIVPEESHFVFFILRPENDDETLKVFNDTLQDKDPVQIGANASIGYGLCEIKHVTTLKKQDNEKN